MFQVVDVNEKATEPSSKSFLKKINELAFGDDGDDENFQSRNFVADEERWDKSSQAKMRQLEELENAVMSNLNDGNTEAQQQIATIVDTLIQDTHGRVFSSIVLRDPSPDAIIRFPDDMFRLFIDCSDNSKPQRVECKLFKRMGGRIAEVELKLRAKRQELNHATRVYNRLDYLERETREYTKQLLDSDSTDNDMITKHCAVYHRVQDGMKKLNDQKRDLEWDIDKFAEECRYLDALTRKAEADRIESVSSRTRLIGKANFELQELLKVLDDDLERVDDVRALKTDLDENVGVLNIRFQYKCKDMQERNAPSDLPLVNKSLSSDEKLSGTSTYEYPFRSHLRLKWKCNGLKKNDRLYLVRDGSTSSNGSHSLLAPAFVMFWRPGGDDPEDAQCEWRVPDALIKLYGNLRELISASDDSKSSGVALFPSAHSLNLLPGRYKICLVRDTVDVTNGTKSRVIIGWSSSLSVIPGENSVHTIFGTTPLIDVRPFLVSLKVTPDKAQRSINSRNPTLLHFDLGQQKVQYDDWVIVRPEEIIQASDNLRAKMLGKLQSKNVEQIIEAQKMLNEELPKTIAMFDTSTYFKAVCFLVLKLRRVLSWTGNQTTQKFLDELWEEYESGSPMTRLYFSLIIHDVVEEISARNALLGLDVKPPFPLIKPSRVRSCISRAIRWVLRCPIAIKPSAISALKVRSLMGVGKAFPIVTNPLDSPQSGDLQIYLGSEFSAGGNFVAKYVRQQPSNAATTDNERLLKATGELGRFGPFKVEASKGFEQRSNLKAKVVQGLLIAYKSNLLNLLLQLLFTTGIGFIKYAFAIANLSFNLVLLARVVVVDIEHIHNLKTQFDALFWDPLKRLFIAFDAFAAALSQLILFKFDLFDISGECLSGFYLVWVFCALAMATLLLYMIVQEDVLLKVQKVDERLPVKGVGSLLIIPIFISTKTCALFLSTNLEHFYNLASQGPYNAIHILHLHAHETSTCKNVMLAKANYTVGVVMVIAIAAFIFVCLPLLILDLYSWVPLASVSEQRKRQQLSYTRSRKAVKEAIRRNASLVEWK